MNPIHPRPLLLGVALLIGLPARAQDTSTEAATAIPVQTLPAPGAAPANYEHDARAVQLDTVVVTGEKLGRSQAETASSVSVTSGKQIEQYGDESIYDLSRRVGNALATGEGSLSLRGVSQFGADQSGGAAVISTYVDGVALDNSALGGNATEAFDVEQVEILRGPQSTSQGRNALAGAVVSTTRDPTGYWDALTRVRLTDGGDRQYAAAGGGPLGAGFAFRLAGQLTGSDGDITNTTRNDPDWAGSSSNLLRGKLAWRPTALPRLRTLLTIATGRTEPGTSYNLEADQDGASAHRTARDNEPSTGKMRSNLGSLKAEAGLSERVTLASTTAGVLSHAGFSGDYDRTAEDSGTYTTLNRGSNVSQELRLNLKDYPLGWGITATGLFGLYGSDFSEAQQFDFRNLKVPLSTVLPQVPGSDQIIARVDGFSDTDNHGRNGAVFSEFDFQFSERLTLTSGLRYDHERRTIIANSDITRADGYLLGNETAPGIPLLIPLKAARVIPTTNGEQRAAGRYHALLPKLGSRYRLHPDWTLFLTYSEAYRAGGAEVLRSSGTINSYKPEYTHNLETGFRATPWARVSVNLNLYGVHWTDQQVRVPVPGDILSTRTENAARSELYGAELETGWRAAKGLNLYASTGYAHTEFKDYVSGGVDYSGKRFVLNAPFTGSLGGSYKHASGLFTALSYSFSQSYFMTPQNTAKERGDIRRLLDARLGWQGRHLAVYAYGRNLLDDDYRTVSYRITQGLGFPQAGYGTSYGELRRIGVQLEARF